MPKNNDAAEGAVALAICESLLLALADLNLINAKDLDGLLSGAADGSRSGGPLAPDVLALIEGVVESAKAVRPI